jgi:hypothetical protein
VFYCMREEDPSRRIFFSICEVMVGRLEIEGVLPLGYIVHLIVVSFWGSLDRYFCIGGAWHVEVSERHSLKWLLCND